MSRRILLKQSKFGIVYRNETDTKFSFFPDYVKNLGDINRFFAISGIDPPLLQWVNQANEPCKLYKVDLSKKFLGQPFAVVDQDEHQNFPFTSPVSDEEKIEFLKDHTTRQQDQVAEKIGNTTAKLQYLLDVCDEGTKAAFLQMLNEAITPEVIIHQCEDNARGYGGLKAEVSFEPSQLT
jgi:hypothetical protein